MGGVIFSQSAFKRTEGWVRHHENTPLNTLQLSRRKPRRRRQSRLKFQLHDLALDVPVDVDRDTGGSGLMGGPVKGEEVPVGIAKPAYNRSEDIDPFPHTPHWAISVLMDNGWEVIAAEMPTP